MKKALIISAAAALGLSSAVFAGGLPEQMPMAPMAMSSDSGFYMGLSGGYGMTNWKNAEKGDANDTVVQFEISKDNGFVGRVFAGFDFNRYFALEAGYSYFFNKPELDNQKFIKSTSAVDVMGKLKAPVADNLDLYAKLGANYLMTKPKKDGADSINKFNFNVAYGAGIDYMITPNVIANVEWLRFNGKSKINDKDYQPHTDAFLVGLRYKFDM